MRSRSVGYFRPGASWLHRRNPLTKLLALMWLLIAAFVLLALTGISTPVAAMFALMFGGANGLVTIARGAVPLTLFGATGYGRLMGRLAGPFLLVQSAAPLVMAFVVERVSDAAALSLAAAFAAVAFICAILIRRPA